MKKIIKEVIPYIIIIIVVTLIRKFIATPVIVSGPSMKPTLKDKEILLLNKVSYKYSNIKRFDIVVIHIDNKEIIKRVIGLPGENVVYRSNKLYIDGHELENDYSFKTDDFSLKTIPNCNNCIKIPEDKYLVLGDNRAISADSRTYGLIDKSEIQGKVDVSIWPPKLVK
jgi:signal peptidase I